MQTMIENKDYPYNLLIAARGNKMMELPPTLTKDVLAGIQYALFILEESEQEVLDIKYRLGLPLSDIQLQIEKKALEKLRYSCRWDYICYGVVGCAKKKAAEAGRKGFIQGYQAGYADGVKREPTGLDKQTAIELLDYPIEAMPLSSRVYNALYWNGCKTVRDVVVLEKDRIFQIRNIGKKGVQEVLHALHSYGIAYSQWELL